MLGTAAPVVEVMTAADATKRMAAMSTRWAMVLLNYGNSTAAITKTTLHM
jgi:hypothetical protein